MEVTLEENGPAEFVTFRDWIVGLDGNSMTDGPVPALFEPVYGQLGAFARCEPIDGIWHSPQLVKIGSREFVHTSDHSNC